MARSHSRPTNSQFADFETTTISEDSIEQPDLTDQESELEVSDHGRVKYVLGATYKGHGKNVQNIIAKTRSFDEPIRPLQPPHAATPTIRSVF
ncbi:unnamed protein product, partial [Mesorhabditis spiculigera]